MIFKKRKRNEIFQWICGWKDMFILEFAQKMTKLIIKCKLLKLNIVIFNFFLIIYSVKKIFKYIFINAWFLAVNLVAAIW